MKKTENYSFADIPVSISHHYTYLSEQCKDYLSEREPLLYLDITKQDIANERVRAEHADAPEPYLESLACYRKFCERAVFEHVLLIHCSAVAVDGVAYLFAAPSGTGKSTHTALWRRVFGQRAIMVNDDKPLLRLSPQDIIVYGTPWDGKHRLSNPISAKVGGICFLSRATENSIECLAPNEALPRLLGQIFRPDNTQGTAQMLQLAIELATRVPLWSLQCNISEDAARLAYHSMNKEIRI